MHDNNNQSISFSYAKIFLKNKASQDNEDLTCRESFIDLMVAYRR